MPCTHTKAPAALGPTARRSSPKACVLLGNGRNRSATGVAPEGDRARRAGLRNLAAVLDAAGTRWTARQEHPFFGRERLREAQRGLRPAHARPAAREVGAGQHQASPRLLGLDRRHRGLAASGPTTAPAKEQHRPAVPHDSMTPVDDRQDNLGPVPLGKPLCARDARLCRGRREPTGPSRTRRSPRPVDSVTAATGAYSGSMMNRCGLWGTRQGDAVRSSSAREAVLGSADRAPGGAGLAVCSVLGAVVIALPDSDQRGSPSAPPWPSVVDLPRRSGDAGRVDLFCERCGLPGGAGRVAPPLGSCSSPGGLGWSSRLSPTTRTGGSSARPSCSRPAGGCVFRHRTGPDRSDS